MNKGILIQAGDFAKTREVKESHIRELWERGGYFSDSNMSNCETALYLRFTFSRETAYNEMSLEKGHNNIKQKFRPFEGWETCDIPNLPDDWDEIYISDAGYHAKFGRKGKLVARNNYDGTAQMFRV